MLNFAISGIVSFSRAPLKISIIIGLVISFLSIAYGLFSIMIYFTNSSLPAGWTTLITAISFLGGLQLISIGIIGEYISSIFDEVKKRPLYIIEEEYGFKQNESK
jgi:glycosyltransferase involved in cell wall biosynthesis